jgi:flagellar basal body-associated protein FliL
MSDKELDDSENEEDQKINSWIIVAIGIIILIALGLLIWYVFGTPEPTSINDLQPMVGGC